MAGGGGEGGGERLRKPRQWGHHQAPAQQQQTVPFLQETQRRGHARACPNTRRGQSRGRCITAQPTALAHAQAPVSPPGMLNLTRGLPTAPGAREQLEDVCLCSDRHGLRQSSRAHRVYFPPGTRHTSSRPAARRGLRSCKPAARRLSITLLV